jgi:hypothetical protein
MTVSLQPLKGRRFSGGPFLLLLAALLATVSLAAADDDPSLPYNMRPALDRIAQLKKAATPDLSALQLAYLTLFENFPRHQKGKEGIFELYHLMRRNQRTDQAYAALMKIEAVYQDFETMAYPARSAQLVGMVATARLEEAFLYASQMKNPFHAIDTVNAVLARYREQWVGLDAPDRAYLGRVDTVARLHLAGYRLQADQTNQATTDLLALAHDWPGETLMQNGVEQKASIAAVRALQPALAAMPASLAKKLRLIETFDQTVIDETARVWLAFTRAELDLADFQTEQNRGSYADGIAALRDIVEKHPAPTIADAEGEEPAGVRALRRLRDAEARLGDNAAQAGQTLEGYYARFGADARQRTLAAYALLFLAELDLDFRHNAPAAYKEFMLVAERYGDILLYPQTAENKDRTVKEHALVWAARAQKKM